MSGKAQFTLALNIKTTNEDRIAAYELYKRAFDAEKLGESLPPGGKDLHLMIRICGMDILLGPGSAVGAGMDNPIICEVRFSDEEAFDKAYKALTEEGKDASLEGPYPWAAKLGLVTDKFGIGWALYYNE